mmetsp:Transcript_49046/g.157782  ORF Transcript_49046/g.157782 Transcript_49046/m.157782 type:complete len:221 (+) Transcript_49046:567-1229(+)
MSYEPVSELDALRVDATQFLGAAVRDDGVPLADDMQGGDVEQGAWRPPSSGGRGPGTHKARAEDDELWLSQIRACLTQVRAEQGGHQGALAEAQEPIEGAPLPFAHQEVQRALEASEAFPYVVLLRQCRQIGSGQRLGSLGVHATLPCEHLVHEGEADDFAGRPLVAGQPRHTCSIVCGVRRTWCRKLHLQPPRAQAVLQARQSIAAQGATKRPSITVDR